MIYADNAATTRMSSAALRAMQDCMAEQWGNPSSLYGLGQRAKEALEHARARIAACIGASAGEIIFTSWGQRGGQPGALFRRPAGGAKKQTPHSLYRL